MFIGITTLFIPEHPQKVFEDGIERENIDKELIRDILRSINPEFSEKDKWRRSRINR